MEVKPKEEDGYVDDWQIRKYSDCHPSSATRVWEKDEMLKEVFKIIDDEVDSYNDKKNYSLNGEKKRCCQMALKIVKQKLQEQDLLTKEWDNEEDDRWN